MSKTRISISQQVLGISTCSMACWIDISERFMQTLWSELIGHFLPKIWPVYCLRIHRDQYFWFISGTTGPVSEIKISAQSPQKGAQNRLLGFPRLQNLTEIKRCGLFALSSQLNNFATTKAVPLIQVDLHSTQKSAFSAAWIMSITSQLAEIHYTIFELASKCLLIQ